MPLRYSHDAMPWVWLFFSLNTSSITVIAIAMKLLPVDLTTIKPNNNGIESKSDDLNVKNSLFMLPILATFSVALTVPTSRRILELQYKELHKLPLNYQDINFSYRELAHDVKKYINEVSVSNNDVQSEIKEYAKYVVQIEDDAKLSERVLRKSLKAVTQLLTEYEKNEPSNLMKLLEKSKGFKGVVEFDNVEVPLLHSEENQNPWSLVVVILTAIVIALPNTANNYAEGLLASTREGLQIVRNIEECLHANSDLVKARKAARRLWTQVEVYHKWLHIDLQKKARNGKTSKEILQWLGDESIKTTMLLHCNEQENWPNDGELFDWMSTVIADILCACFTNLPRVIKRTCHHDAIEKREDSVWSAAQLLGKSKKILEILEARQLPNLDVDSMAYIDKWHALPKSVIPNGCASVNHVSLTSFFKSVN
ncbi:hypothetical protein Tco_0575444 [Tanacetum coccineum]